MSKKHAQKKSKQNYIYKAMKKTHFLPKPKCHSGNCTQKEIYTLHVFISKENNIKNKVSFYLKKLEKRATK